MTSAILVMMFALGTLFFMLELLVKIGNQLDGFKCFLVSSVAMANILGGCFGESPDPHSRNRARGS